LQRARAETSNADGFFYSADGFAYSADGFFYSPDGFFSIFLLVEPTSE
jgi:hypothetical protein